MPHPDSGNEPLRFDSHYLRRAFDKRSKQFAATDFLMREISQRMQSHLALIKIKPERILDMGCAIGQDLAILRNLYPQAEILGLDLSFEMLAQVTASNTLFSQLRHLLLGRSFPLIQADWCHLPLTNQCIDLIWSNLALHWTPSPHLALKEWIKLLRVNGLLMFSTFGPDSLRELRVAFAHTDAHQHIPAFTDMHDLGDMLLDQGLADPVVDAEYLTVTYETPKKLLEDVRRLGIYPYPQPGGLKGKQWYQRLSEALEAQRRDDNLIPLSFELIYAHAWKPERNASVANKEGIAHIGLDQIGYKQRR